MYVCFFLPSLSQLNWQMATHLESGSLRFQALKGCFVLATVAKFARLFEPHVLV